MRIGTRSATIRGMEPNRFDDVETRIVEEPAEPRARSGRGGSVLPLLAVTAALALTGSLAAGASALTSTAQAPTRAAEKSGHVEAGASVGQARRAVPTRANGADVRRRPQLLALRIRRRQSEGQRLRVGAGAQRRRVAPMRWRNVIVDGRVGHRARSRSPARARRAAARAGRTCRSSGGPGSDDGERRVAGGRDHGGGRATPCTRARRPA